MPYTVSAGNDRILVAVYTGGGNDDVGSGTQFLDMSFTKEKQALSTCCIVTMKASVWVLRLGSGAAIADTLCLNINSSGGTDLRLHVFELHNVDQINTIGNTSIAGNLNASVLANGGDLVLGIMVQRSPGDNPTLSEASGQTEIFNIAGNGNQDQYAGAYTLVGSTGTINDNWTATGGFPNRAHLVLEINKSTPGIQCPASATINCGDPADPLVTGEAYGTGTCSNLDSAYTDVMNATSITRTWTIPGCSPVPSCEQNIQIIDNMPPAINCPNDRTVSCTESTAPANTGTPTVMDPCDPMPTITFSDMDPGGINCRTIIRTWEATDASGNLSRSGQQGLLYDHVHPAGQYRECVHGQQSVDGIRCWQCEPRTKGKRRRDQDAGVVPKYTEPLQRGDDDRLLVAGKHDRHPQGDGCDR